MDINLAKFKDLKSRFAKMCKRVIALCLLFAVVVSLVFLAFAQLLCFC